MNKKIIIICIIVAVAVFAASLGITYAVITVSRTPAATPDEAATIDSAVSATEPPTKTPTEAPTDPPTESPTEPPYLDAYRAFRKVLRDNESDIRAYTWQYKTDTPQPIAFADIMGDDTLEMIYAYVDQNDNKPQMGGTNAAAVHIKVITFDGSKAVEATDYGFPIYGSSDSGVMFVAQINGELYTFDHETGGVYQFDTAHRFVDNKNNTLHQKIAVRDTQTPIPGTGTAEYIVDDQNVSPSEAAEAYTNLVKKTDAILMSSSDTQGKSYPRSLGLDTEHYPNQSMTFDKAIAFLNDIIEDK